jgi:hypothetical protein
MNFLRDESGYALVLGRPRLILVGKATEEAEETQPLPKAAQPVKSATCAVPHCCFVCEWCGVPILLPNDRIGSPFGNPDVRKIDVRSIATVCLNCKHIGNYSMFRGCHGYDTRHKIVHTPSSGTTALLNWLHCVESTCTARVPLFAKLDSDEAENPAVAAQWLWDGLTCASGHRIKQIPLDPTTQLPLRAFGTSR